MGVPTFCDQVTRSFAMCTSGLWTKRPDRRLLGDLCRVSIFCQLGLLIVIGLLKGCLCFFCPTGSFFYRRPSGGFFCFSFSGLCRFLDDFLTGNRFCSCLVHRRQPSVLKGLPSL